jgi:hypothetical protein
VLALVRLDVVVRLTVHETLINELFHQMILFCQSNAMLLQP